MIRGGSILRPYVRSACCGMVLLLLCRFTEAQEAAVPLAAVPSVLLKGVVRNRNLKLVNGKEIHIGVLYKDAPAEAELVVAAFTAVPKTGLLGYTVVAKAIVFTTTADLLKNVETLSGLYIHSSMLTGLSTALQVTRSKNIPSLGGSRVFVEQGGALGVYQNQGKPKLILNLKSCRSEGISLDPAISYIATVIK